MTIHVHKLLGCKPVPLASYLKALGVLRLVSRQMDPEARACFRDDTFLLCTYLDEQALVRFFCDSYSPTPLIAPWNGGSGFYPKDNREGFDAIRASTAPRLAHYRDAIRLAMELVGDLKEAPKDEPKYALQRAVRQRAGQALADWLDAVFVFDGEGAPSYPALLGTGGNDGRLDFTNNFMRRLSELFAMAEDGAPARAGAEQLVRAALLGQPIAGLSEFAIGQFLPGAVGGANSGAGFRGTAAINPWDFVLLLEGAAALHPSAVKQLDSQDLVQAGAPFAFRSSALGYASSAEAEDGGARGEQWMPLWRQPATFAEVATMFAEGRSQVQRTSAQRPLDFARSVARLGVSRGIEAFQRYGFIERNGQANLAVPLARWKVQPAVQQDLVDEAAPWVDRLRMYARSDTAPASIKRAVRECEESMLAACADGAGNAVWQRLLLSLGRAERALLRSPKFTAEKHLRPLPGLSLGWLSAAQDDSREWRVAVALASLHNVAAQRPGRTTGRAPASRLLPADWDHPLRGYALPLAAKGDSRFRTFDLSDTGLLLPPHVVMRGRSVVDDMCVLALRRTQDPPETSRGTLGFTPTKGNAALLTDIAAFVHGAFDDLRCAELMWPLMALRWWDEGTVPRVREPRDQREAAVHQLAVFGLFRAAAPLAAPEGEDASYARIDPAMLRALHAGQTERAGAIAIRRLQAADCTPRAQAVGAPAALARRLLAALLIPLSPGDLLALKTSIGAAPPDPSHRDNEEGEIHA